MRRTLDQLFSKDLTLLTDTENLRWLSFAPSSPETSKQRTKRQMTILGAVTYIYSYLPIPWKLYLRLGCRLIFGSDHLLSAMGSGIYERTSTLVSKLSFFNLSINSSDLEDYDFKRE